MAAAVAELIGSPVTVARVTPQEQTATLTQVGLDAATAGFVVAIDAATERGDLAIRTGALARLIGHPTTSLVDGLRPPSPDGIPGPDAIDPACWWLAPPTPLVAADAPNHPTFRLS